MNPIRAAMAESPDKAVHTSAYDRILENGANSRGQRQVRECFAAVS